MNELGRIEDLPESYRAALSEQNLVPLWPSLRTALPPDRPNAVASPMHWSYEKLRPLLMQAGDLTPMEKAERRVLVLANPNYGPGSVQVSPCMYMGFQLLLPGEFAPTHRHTPNAVRLVMEGSGGYTTVDGDVCPMEPGDLILTPTGLWHEHHHDGDEPVVWLDVLDLPLVYYMEASWVAFGSEQASAKHGVEYSCGGVVPTRVFERDNTRYAMLRYPWSQVRKVLEQIADDRPANEPVQVTYINPENGEPAQNILGFYAMMLRPGEELTLPVRSPASVFCLLEGSASVQIGERKFDLAPRDTCCAPGFTPIAIANRSRTEPAFLFVADEAPVQRKLGLYEVR